MPKNNPPLSRSKNVCERYQISSMTLYRWEKRPGFPLPSRIGRLKFYDLEAIDAWLAKEGAE